MSKQSGNGKYSGLSGKIGGLAVKGMIREMENRIAGGETIPAGASSAEEAEHLQNVRKANAGQGGNGEGSSWPQRLE